MSGPYCPSKKTCPGYGILPSPSRIAMNVTYTRSCFEFMRRGRPLRHRALRTRAWNVCCGLREPSLEACLAESRVTPPGPFRVFLSHGNVLMSYWHCSIRLCT